MESLDVEDLGIGCTATSDVSVEHARRLAAVLDADDEITEGMPLALLWHWAFFTPSAPTAALGADGHPRLPAAGPTAGLPRRMWAGGRVTSHGPLRAGLPAVRRSAVVRADRKSGRSGDLLVVTVAHEVEQEGEVVVSESQDLVYRTAGSPIALPIAAPGGAAPPDGWSEAVSVDHVRLFRFSAVTFNGHRIHYDEAYAAGVEGYPGLVVHGPLTALLLAESVRRRAFPCASFEFRATAPLFGGVPFRLVGRRDGPGVQLEAVRNDGTVAMSARAT